MKLNNKTQKFNILFYNEMQNNHKWQPTNACKIDKLSEKKKNGCQKREKSINSLANSNNKYKRSCSIIQTNKEKNFHS